LRTGANSHHTLVSRALLERRLNSAGSQRASGSTTVALAWPTTVIRSRWPRALTRTTQKPFSRNQRGIERGANPFLCTRCAASSPPPALSPLIVVLAALPLAALPLIVGLIALPLIIALPWIVVLAVLPLSVVLAALPLIVVLAALPLSVVLATEGSYPPDCFGRRSTPRRRRRNENTFISALRVRHRRRLTEQARLTSSSPPALAFRGSSN
jgi:hypothetical protein